MPIYDIFARTANQIRVNTPYQQVRRIGGMSEMQTPGRQGFIQFFAAFPVTNPGSQPRLPVAADVPAAAAAALQFPAAADKFKTMTNAERCPTYRYCQSPSPRREAPPGFRAHGQISPREITIVIVSDFGPDEMLQRLSHPYWFQAFGCVAGF